MSPSNRKWGDATDILVRESEQQPYISDRAAFSILADIAKRRRASDGASTPEHSEGSDANDALDVFAQDQSASNHAQFKLHKATLATLLKIIKLQWLIIALLLITLWRAW